MNIIKRLLPISLATFIILVSAAVVFASADELTSPQRGQNFNAEHYEAVQSALDAGDYNAWVTAVTQDGHEARMLEYINADNFGQFVEMYQLREKARAIAEKLGLPQGGMMGGEGFKGKGPRPELTDEQKALMEKVNELKQSGDLEGAKALLEESGIEWGSKFYQGFQKGEGKKRGFFQPQN